MTILANVGELYARLGEDAAGDPQVAALWPGAERAIKDWCGWQIERTTATDYYDGTNYIDLPLKRMWVVNDNTLAVYVDVTGAYGQGSGAFSSSQALLTKGRDYALVLDEVIGTTEMGKSGILRRLQSSGTGLWPSDIVNRRQNNLTYQKPVGWSFGIGNIKVVCNTGFNTSTMPDVLKDCVAEAVSIFRNSVKTGVRVTSENLGDYSYSGQLAQAGEFGTIRAKLSAYRDWGGPAV